MFDYYSIQDINYPKVRNAFDEKVPYLEQLFKEKNLKFPPEKILLTAYKEEMVFELWACSETNSLKFTLISKYKFTKLSGKPGPKRKEGDKQVPEGFYYINRFNPESKYYLALGTNYPNKSDKILGDKNAPGSDIFIHGSDKSVGCIPLGDDKIKEVYVMADIARHSGQKEIPVYIFPCRMEDNKIKELKNKGEVNSDTIKLWNNLKTGYDIFMKNFEEINYITDDKGNYIYR